MRRAMRKRAAAAAACLAMAAITALAGAGCSGEAAPAGSEELAVTGIELGTDDNGHDCAIAEIEWTNGSRTPEAFNGTERVTAYQKGRALAEGFSAGAEKSASEKIGPGESGTYKVYFRLLNPKKPVQIALHGSTGASSFTTKTFEIAGTGDGAEGPQGQTGEADDDNQ